MPVRPTNTPRRTASKDNVLIDLQKDLYMDDLAPLNNGALPLKNTQNRISLQVVGACDAQINDLEQRLIKIIAEWKITLREEE